MSRYAFKLIGLLAVIILNYSCYGVEAETCGQNGTVYGSNEIVDQILVCALSKAADLDLLPKSTYMKSTSPVFVEIGFANKTSMMSARLSGLWTGRRVDFAETAWTCSSKKTIVSALIEINGLALDVIEKVEIPLHRNQQKLNLHKPCKTLELPIWMCRQTKAIYRTTKTWVNRAYFNLTLAQNDIETRPTIEHFSLAFTCPETFKQKIVHSPSSSYLVPKLAPISSLASSQSKQRHVRSTTESLNEVPIPHPLSYSSTQDGNGPVTPSYHKSVNLIVGQATSALRSAISECIQDVESDLSFTSKHSSFSTNQFSIDAAKEGSESVDGSFMNECSYNQWLINRVGLSVQAKAMQIPMGGNSASNSKRDRLVFKAEPDQLLDPYGYYHDTNRHDVEMNTFQVD